MDTKEAKHWGLINEVVEKKDVLKELGRLQQKSQKGLT